MPTATRPRRSSLRIALALGAAALAALAAAPAEARTRTFCGVVTRSCGGHLQPVCTSGAACDPGHTSYSGSPFPITINCPWPIPDVKVSGGCYDERPDCGDCSAKGQIPCPVEAEPWCTAGCDPGLFEQFGLCSDGSISFPDAGPNETCAPGIVGCESGLQCTAALLCSHEPAREGETCDVSAPCAPGLYCQAGIPQVCKRKRTVGEGCSVFKPCAEGLSCEACFTESCNAPFQCFPNANEGAITEQQCRQLYSPVIADGITGGADALTWAGGNAVTAGASEAQAFGVAYGPNGEFGCYTSFCYGVTVDLSITAAFTSIGAYTSFDAVGGESFVNTQTAQTPFDFLSFSFSQVYERFGDGFPPVTGDLIGVEDALAVGAGANPSPFSAGSMYCETILDPVSLDPGQNATPPLVLPPLEYIVNGDFESDLYGWTCTNGGRCGWSWDSPFSPASPGAGRVRSPSAGELEDLGGIDSSCVQVQEGVPYQPSVWIKTTGGVQGSASIRWSESEDCADFFMGQPIGSSPPDGVWRKVSADLPAPEGARSAWLRAIAIRHWEDGEASTTYIDRAYIPEPGSAAAVAAAAAALGGLAARRRRNASRSDAASARSFHMTLEKRNPPSPRAASGNRLPPASDTCEDRRRPGPIPEEVERCPSHPRAACSCWLASCSLPLPPRR